MADGLSESLDGAGAALHATRSMHSRTAAAAEACRTRCMKICLWPATITRIWLGFDLY
jgi:hypothetical protein